MLYEVITRVDHVLHILLDGMIHLEQARLGRGNRFLTVIDRPIGEESPQAGQKQRGEEDDVASRPAILPKCFLESHTVPMRMSRHILADAISNPRP